MSLKHLKVRKTLTPSLILSGVTVATFNMYSVDIPFFLRLSYRSKEASYRQTMKEYF